MKTNNDDSTSVTRLSLVLARYVLIAVTGLLLTAPAMARAESAWFDIAAQPLPAALRAFAAQAQMQLLYEHGTVASASGNAVNGELDKQAALAQLLRNTGLEVVYSSEGAATIRPAVDKPTKANVRESNRLRLAQVDQSASRRDTADDLTRNTLEEVIVTARRREENIQRVPVAITALSQQTLQENNIATVTDLRHLVPSLSGTTGLSRDAFNVAIRGQRESNGRPGVVMYLNDVPLPTEGDGGALSGGPGLLFDLENVQVLKGPQGTLFGRESVGGAVLLQTARPKNELGGRIQLGAGNYEHREIDAAVNVPIVDDVLLTRVAFNGAKRDGFTWLQGDPAHPNGIDIDDRDYWSVRASVTFRPSDSFENDTIATYQDYESNGSVSFLTGVNVPLASALAGAFPSVGYALLPSYLAQQQALGIRTHIPIDGLIESSGTLFAISNITSIALADDLNLRTILGYDRAVTRRAFNGDATPLPLGNQPSTPRVSPIRQYSAEMQLLGKSFDGNLDWIAGAFYLKNPYEDFVLQTGTILGFPNDAKNKRTNTSKALFAQGTYDLSAIATGVKVTAGLRYTWDSKDEYSLGLTFGTNCRAVPPVNCDEANAKLTSAESSALTWTTGLDYQVADDTLLYLASRRGYRAGGANPPVNGIVTDYDPEYVLDYELGIKSDWQVVSLPVRTNAAVFYQDYTDIQVQRSVLLNNSFSNVTDNAAKAELWGTELEALLRLTDDLEIGANASYLNIKYTEFAAGVSAATIADVKAREKLSPDWQYGLSARYRLPLDQRVGDLSVQASWHWQAAFQNTLAASLGVMDIPDYGLLNLAVNLDNMGGGPMDASFFMTNVQDKEYAVGGGSVYKALAYNTTMYGEPRMYGIRLRYRFGAE